MVFQNHSAGNQWTWLKLQPEPKESCDTSRLQFQSFPLIPCRMILKYHVLMANCQKWLIFRNLHEISTYIHIYGVLHNSFDSGCRITHFTNFLQNDSAILCFGGRTSKITNIFEIYAKFRPIFIPVVVFYTFFVFRWIVQVWWQGSAGLAVDSADLTADLKNSVSITPSLASLPSSYMSRGVNPQLFKKKTAKPRPHAFWGICRNRLEVQI